MFLKAVAVYPKIKNEHFRIGNAMRRRLTARIIIYIVRSVDSSLLKISLRMGKN